MSKKFELYITKNLINGKVYGGKHSYTYKRGKYFGSGFRLKRAIKKYGIDNFETRVLKLNIVDIDDLNKREVRLIKLLKFIFKDNCYNIHIGGQGGDLYKYLTKAERLEVNKKISESKKRQYATGETQAQIEGRKKQSIALIELNKDLNFKTKMHIKQKEGGKRLSERIQTKGFTLKEQERNKQNGINQTKIYEIEILYPSGVCEIIQSHSKKFKTTYHTDDSVFAKLRRNGAYQIIKRQSATKHPFPAKTKFRILN